MKIWRKTGILIVVLALAGAARMPFENSMTKDFRNQGLIAPPLEIGTREKIGQTSSAVALGGLRTLVSTFLNLRAFGFFTEQRWSDVEDTYGQIVDLAPRTRYYWETGSWHLSYNAASYYLYDSELAALRRREAWRASILKGRAFLERGIRNNPQDWGLHSELGRLLTDPNKLPAFSDTDQAFAHAADAYKAAEETGNAPPFIRRARLYALARVPGREAEALSLAREIHADEDSFHPPTLLAILFVLESQADPTRDHAAAAIRLFGTPERALDHLGAHWQRTPDRFPTHGLASAIRKLEQLQDIPEEKSILHRDTQPVISVDRWFQD